MKKAFKYINLLIVTLFFINYSCSDDAAAVATINLQDLEVTIDENPTNGQIIGIIESNSAISLTYSLITQTPSGALTINSSTGELTVADETLFDFETNPILTATVSVLGAQNTATVTINLNDLNELGIQDLMLTIAENPTVGQAIGTVLTSGTGNISFSITSETPAGAINIDSNTGELTVLDAALFDFETNPMLTAIISSSDALNTGTVTINLTDLNEISIQDLNITITENPTVGQAIGTVLTSGTGNISFSVTSETPAGAISIDSNTGVITVLDATLFDYEVNPILTAVISSVDALNTGIVTITLTDVVEVATIGDFRDGGVVFWVDPTDNTHGLVLTIDNLAYGAEWGCEGVSIPGATNSAIGTGATNTAAIEAICTTSGTAADIASNLSLNGFDDWFLPSRLEWAEVFTNKTIINATAVANGGLNILNTTSDRYWTSTEDGSTAARAFRGNDGSTNTTLRIAGLKVRAARAF